jgi:hypothetical protein
MCGHAAEFHFECRQKYKIRHLGYLLTGIGFIEVAGLMRWRRERAGSTPEAATG